ncbi:MAG: DUF3592 domain-containing protein [Tepidisphaeraceae bacterium]
MRRPSRGTKFVRVRRGSVLGPMLSKLFVASLIAFWLGLAGYLLYTGWRDVLLQRRLLRDSATVPAKLVARAVVSDSDEDSPRYRPSVRFWYVVDGRAYEGDRLTPLNYANTFRHWGDANDFLRSNFPDDRATARYLPGSPELAYLLPTPVGGCYAMAVGGVLMLLPLIWGVMNLRSAHERRDAKNRILLQPRRSLAKRRLDHLVLALVSAAALGWLLWHFLQVIPSPRGWGAWAGWGVAFLPMACSCLAMLHAHGLSHVVGDATVAIADLHPGYPSALAFEQAVRSDGAVVERVRIGLFCREHTGSGEDAKVTTVHEQWSDHPAPAISGGAGERCIRFDTTMSLPSAVPVSTADGDDTLYITHSWTLRVETILIDLPTYSADYPVQVTTV